MENYKTDNQSTESTLCPFFGLFTDADTAVAYPSSLNHCYHEKEAVSIKLAHQQIVTKKMTAFNLASETTAIPTLIKQYNTLSGGHKFTVGEWVLIPR
ncbi:MAG: hypothetical protein NTZ74_00395 [Chloroflexi bacterium]|nr:hypothetical protein [Chloroflexota bacterium]